MEKPEKILQEFSARHPGIWKYVDRCRAEKGKQFLDWPDWCYLPVSATYTYVVTELSQSPEFIDLDSASPDAMASAARMYQEPKWRAMLSDASLASALAAWRMGRGIYRFDQDFAAALAETPVDGDLPVDLFYHLPEWGLYIELPGHEQIAGVFACLEADYNTHVPELRLTFDLLDDAPFLIPLHLDSGTTILAMMAGAAELAEENTRKFALQNLMPLQREATGEKRTSEIVGVAIPYVINLVLYLCSSEPDYHGAERPRNPAVIKTKKGPRIFPAATARIWKIGERSGNLLRQARQAPHQPDERNAPRPHLRRAHWHTYRVGEGRQGFRVRWLHPILVGRNSGD